MITKELKEEFYHCSACGKYNKQHNLENALPVQLCGSEIHEYKIGSMIISLCKNCENELIRTIIQDRSIMQMVADTVAEKDKEIAKYKELLEITNLEGLKVENMLLKGEVKNNKETAVKYLERVKDKMLGLLSNYSDFSAAQLTEGYVKFIDNQIKELKEDLQ